MFSYQLLQLPIRIRAQIHGAINHGHRRIAILLSFGNWNRTGLASWRRQDGRIVHVAMVGDSGSQFNACRGIGRLTVHLWSFDMTVCVVNAVHRLRIWRRSRGLQVG